MIIGALPSVASAAAVYYLAPYGGELPHRRRSTSRDVPFAPDGFHALLAPQTGCFSAFPYGTCSLSVTTLSYLALEGQHPLYSASTFKLAYSRANSSRTRPTRSRVTPCATGTQPDAVDSALAEPALRLQVPRPRRVVRIRSRANPCSLAATKGISIDFFSSADLYA